MRARQNGCGGIDGCRGLRRIVFGKERSPGEALDHCARCGPIGREVGPAIGLRRGKGTMAENGQRQHDFLLRVLWVPRRRRG